MNKLDNLLILLLGFELFFLPLISFPLNFNHFEFPKLIVFYLFSIIFLAIFAIKLITKNTVVTYYNYATVFLISFLVIYLLSAIYSLTPVASILGVYPRMQDGVIFLISSIVVFFTASHIAERVDIKKIFIYPALAGIIVMMVAIMQMYNGLIRVPGLEDHPIYFAASLMVFFFIYKILEWEIAAYGTFIIIILSLTRSVWISFGIALLITIVILIKKRLINYREYLNLRVLVFLACLLLVLVFKREVLLDKFKQTFNANIGENNLIIRLKEVQAVWKITLDFPLFGIGPSALTYYYPRYRPLELNYTSEWQQNADYARNAFLQYAATIGLPGVVAYIGFISLILFYTAKRFLSQKVSGQIKAEIALIGGFLALVIQQLFYHPTVTSNLFFWIFAGFLAGFTVSKEKIVTLQSKFIKFLGWGILTFCLVGIFVLGRLFVADIIFVQGLKTFNLLSNDPTKKNVFLFFRGNFSSHDLNLTNQGFQKINEAIKLNPWNDIYKREGVYMLLTQAKIYKDFQQLDQAQKSYDQALELINKAVQSQPMNSLNYYFQALVYIQMAKINPFYGDLAIESMKKSVNLNPKNPAEYNNLGLMYLDLQKYQEAEQAFRQAINLKNNLAESYFHLGETLKQKGDLDGARKVYAQVLNFEPHNSFAKNEIKKLNPY